MRDAFVFEGRAPLGCQLREFGSGFDQLFRVVHEVRNRRHVLRQAYDADVCDEINARIDAQETHRGRFGEPRLFEFVASLGGGRAGAIDVRLFAFAALPQPLRKVGESLCERERLIG